MNQPQKYLTQVRDQYEDLPYPPRNPEDERHRLLPPIPDSLELLNHYCFEGREKFANHFRVLAAGAGTGDAVIYLGEQLRDTNAEIVYLDISEASMEIAKQRAEIRGLTNIRWVHASLLDIPKLDLGAFDYINCVGVLHHLANPDSGLSALSSALKENGAMGIMLYGAYGRTGVYMVQNMLRLLTQNLTDRREKIAVCKTLLANLMPTHWFRQKAHLFSSSLNNPDDEELYDLFLHGQDRAFTVPEIHSMLTRNRLHLQDFLYARGIGKSIYDPLNFVQDAGLKALMQSLDRPSRQSIAELLCGDIVMHIFYATRQPRPKPSFADPDYVPFFFSQCGAGAKEAVMQAIRQSPTDKVTVQYERNTAFIGRTPRTLAMIEKIDGSHSVGDIIAVMRAADPALAEDRAAQECADLLNALHMHDWLLLRHKTVPPFRDCR